jgi:colanic acid/amylovoran biosynthesis protein
MMIEIHGGGFNNKGAQLMLWTVLQRLRQADPGLRFCVDANRLAPYAARAAYELHTVFPVASWKGRERAVPAFLLASRLVGAVLPKALCAPYGLVRRQDADALLDISGYAFGDKWGWRLARNLAARAASYRRRGKPVILLPQMLGPFDDPRVRAMFARLKEHADVVYARDRVSLHCARNAGGRTDNVRIAPDITVFCDASPRTAPLAERGYVCFVPNTRMLDKGRDLGWGDYVSLMQAAGREVIARGLRVAMVVHDSAGSDAALAERMTAGLDRTRCDLYVEPDPVRIKQFIGGARLLVGSRFHSIVGALSTGVPAVTLGWAHKYDALLEDFGAPQLMHRPSDPPEHLVALVREMLDDGAWERVHRTLLDAKVAMRPANDAMWGDVLARLGVPDAPRAQRA